MPNNKIAAMTRVVITGRRTNSSGTVIYLKNLNIQHSTSNNQHPRFKGLRGFNNELDSMIFYLQPEDSFSPSECLKRKCESTLQLHSIQTQAQGHAWSNFFA